MSTQEKKPISKIMIICTKENLADVLPPLIMANGALMEGMKAELYFTFAGLKNITKGKKHSWNLKSAMIKSRMKTAGIPDVEEFIEQIKAGGGRIFACKMGMEVYGLTEENLRDDVDGVLSIGEFYDRAIKDTQIIFT